ncbi:DUF4328 domain-containing protein [Promicromonospora vindobonensis]|uniref:DUF4328 domain-containing protein n=1 Tax=Promicromonospora vindobonensis TaxID=195748 RepID=A0ABW5VXW6_9MICO
MQGIAVAWCLLLLVDCVAAFQASDVWRDAATSGLAWGQVEVTPYDSIGYFYLPVQVAAFLVGCRWLYRSRRLADVLSPSSRHTHRPSRVWLAWAFPVINLWFPYQVVRDIRRATVGPAATTAPVQLWWLLWLVWIAVDVAAYLVLDAVTPAIGPDATLVTAVRWFVTGSTVLGVACGAVWLRLIDEITSAQRARLTTSGEVS